MLPAVSLCNGQNNALLPLPQGKENTAVITARFDAVILNDLDKIHANTVEPHCMRLSIYDNKKM